MFKRAKRSSGNLAARVGRWSVCHRRMALLLWLGFVVVAMAVAGVGVGKTTTAESQSGDSTRAEQLLADAKFVRPAGEQVLVQVHEPDARVIDGEGAAAISDVIQRIEATGVVNSIRSPLDPAGAPQVSADGRSALVLFAMNGDADTAYKRVAPVVDAVTSVQADHPNVRVEEFGSASAGKAVDDTVGEDFTKAEKLSIPITFGILLVAFGALVAALVPLGLAITAILGAGGLLAITSHLVHVDTSATSVMLLIGLAVGVDYSLFYIRRRQEERAAGRGSDAAVEAAAATSGHAVLISGLTVIAAMSGMFLTGQATFIGMAEATVLVVATALVGSLTVLPATLSWLGDRLERGRVPWLGRWLERRRESGGSRVWAAILRPVLARPAIALVLGVGLLVVLALPALHLRTATPGATDLPDSMPIVQTYNRIQQAFPGGPVPARVVITSPDVTSPVVSMAIDLMHHEAVKSGQMFEPVTVDISPDHTVAAVDIPLAGDGTNGASQAAVRLLRSRIIPATVGAVADAHVTGSTASSMDFNSQLGARAPYVFAFVLGLAFLLLMSMFRSIVVAAKAIVLNLLSVGASYGVLVAVFQWGWGENLLDFRSTGSVAAFLPLFLFVILFGLSMDYHVFILSRMKESHDRGLSTHEAVHHGIVSSAGVVTSAAVIMVAVFATWTTVSQVSLKELGFGLAIAVLLDATIVRGVLLPAAMILLGEKNWYLPRWLKWLPGGRTEPPVGPSAPAEVAALPTPVASQRVG